MFECKIGCETLYFTIEIVVSSKSKLGCEAGCGLSVLFSDHARIGPALEMTFHQFSDICSEILQCNFFVAGAIFAEVGGGHLLLRAL